MTRRVGDTGFLALVTLMHWLIPVVAVAGSVQGDAPVDTAAAEFFESRIRPLLVEHCHACHAGDNRESQLNLDSLAGLLEGGTRGPAIVPGKPSESLLISAVMHGELLKMPPRAKLSSAEVGDLVRWVELGSPWPGAELPANPSRTASGPKAAAGAEPELSAEAKSFWAFRPPEQPEVPSAADDHWSTGPIDRFIFLRLREAGLEPAPPVEKRLLLRRATFDLIGLPPTPEEVAAFLADDSPEAFARVVERLLESAHYGEKWGRHWLDVARYADSNGLDENLAYANAWRYRDYVIAAFNQDKPYDQFVREQIAGDLLTPDRNDSRRLEQLTGTGFLSLGAKMLAEDDPMKMQMDIIDEQVDTLGRTFLGLTLGCARCHDHKFDPITTADYYGLAGIFKSTRTMENFQVVARWQELPLLTDAALAAQRAEQEQIATREAEIMALVTAEGERVRRELAGQPSAGSDAGREPSPADGDTESRFSAEVRENLRALRADVAARRAELHAPADVMAVSDEKSEDLRIHIRGSHLTLGTIVPRRIPRIFTAGQVTPLQVAGSGRRELADWLTDPAHPLTARVFVNRVWQWHFVAAIVRSPDNFGLLGERPTHPELLDWLAGEFVRTGWSVKSLHRLMMLSATYRMSGNSPEPATTTDPENRLWWKFPRRRLDAEELRDALLAVGGTLDRGMGGTLLTTENRAYVTSTTSVNPDVYRTNRRSVYVPVVRSALYDVFQAFDFADPTSQSGLRQTTTVAPQALFMMNSEVVAQQTLALARKLLAECPDDAARVRTACLVAYGREPLGHETEQALAYLADYGRRIARDAEAGTDGGATSVAAGPEVRTRAWQSYCRALVSANEFLFVE